LTVTEEIYLEYFPPPQHRMKHQQIKNM